MENFEFFNQYIVNWQSNTQRTLFEQFLSSSYVVGAAIVWPTGTNKRAEERKNGRANRLCIVQYRIETNFEMSALSSRCWRRSEAALTSTEYLQSQNHNGNSLSIILVGNALRWWSTDTDGKRQKKMHFFFSVCYFAIEWCPSGQCRNRFGKNWNKIETERERKVLNECTDNLSATARHLQTTPWHCGTSKVYRQTQRPCTCTLCAARRSTIYVQYQLLLLYGKSPDQQRVYLLIVLWEWKMPFDCIAQKHGHGKHYVKFQLRTILNYI